MLPPTLMDLRYLYYALWFAPVPVFVCLATFMVRRKLHKQMPLFFAYTIFQLADFAVCFYCHHRSELDYFYAYWTSAAIGAALGFGVLYEVFTGVFRPFLGLREFGTVLFRWAALVLLLAAVLLVTSSAPVSGNRIFSSILNLERSVEVMQCGLVLLMLLCSSYLGLSIKHRIFGIALGFGIIASVDLIAVTVFATLGQQSADFVKVTKLLTYDLSAMLWMGYVYAGAVERRPEKRLFYAERWNYALASAMNPVTDSSALPLIEHTVDRVWKQANGHSRKSDGPQSADQ